MSIEQSTNLDTFLNMSKSVNISVSELGVYFADMNEWCVENLAKTGWYFDNYIQVTDSTGNTLIIARKVVFTNNQDALAFRMKFNIW